MKKYNYRNWLEISPPYLLMWGSFLLYLNSFGNGWTFDDYAVILKSSDVRSFSGFLADKYPGRPLRELTFLLDYKLFGYDPVGWHIQNILWHALNASLVYTLAKQLLSSTRVAWLAALFFLVHPVHVEVVVQASHRKDSLALFFVLMSVCCYLEFRNRKKIGYVFLTLLFIVVGCYAKINAVMSIAVILGYEIIYHKKYVYAYTVALFSALVALYKTPYFIDEFVERTQFVLLRNGYDGGFDLIKYIYVVIKSWLFLFLKLVYPVDLAVNYFIRVPTTFHDPWVICAILLLLAYLLAIFFTRNRWPHACFCLVWAGVFYLPTANFWPINWLAADRYLYAPSVGFFILAAYLLGSANMSKVARYSVVIAIVLICTVFVVKQNAVWKSNATLWTHAMKVNADSVYALVNVASVVYHDQPDKQLELLYRALAINPQYSFTYYVLGKNHEARGDDVAAMKNFRKFFIYYNAGFESGFKYWTDELRSHVDSRYHLKL